MMIRTLQVVKNVNAGGQDVSPESTPSPVSIPAWIVSFRTLNGFHSPHYPGFATSQGAGRHTYFSVSHCFHRIQQ